jgi:multidrug efflux pump subunit AcrA (membrane-fusion protein)
MLDKFQPLASRDTPVEDNEALPITSPQGRNVAAFANPAGGASATFSSKRGAGPARISLFDPNQFLALIVVLCWPLKYFPIVLIPSLLLAGLTTIKHWTDISSDVRSLLGEFHFVVHLVLSLLIVNLGARLSTGAVIRGFGGASHEFGLTFFLGFIPRFYIDRSAIAQLPRSGQLWAYGSPLLVRISFITFGILMWATYRSGGTWMANLALLLSQVGLWAFLLAVIPLLPGDGYNWLATYFAQPVLRQKAFSVLRATLRGMPIPPRVRPSEVPMLIIFAVSSLVTMVTVAFILLAIWGVLLITSLQGLGAVIFVGLLISFSIWLLGLKGRVVRRRQRAREIHLLRSKMIIQSKTPKANTTSVPLQRKHWLAILAGATTALILMAFLPYSYETAGSFQIVPSQRGEAIARSDGDVVDVAIREGEWVDRGQVLAHLFSSDQQQAITFTRSRLERAEAALMELDTKILTSRQSERPPAARISAVETEREAARDEVERLRQQLRADEAELERTNIRAPTAGFVTTANPQLLDGVWLNAGDAFLRVDDTRVVQAEILIPQGDVVRLGAKVRLRPWSGDREVLGWITEIAPSALATRDKKPNQQTERRTADTLPDPGRVATTAAYHSGLIRVKAIVPNAGGSLRPAMTGYAKVSGPQMRLGEAYFRFCIRLFKTELWSLVP